MEWTVDAEAALKRVPFFVRKQVRTRVEKEARDAGKAKVTLADVDATKARYLAGMHRYKARSRSGKRFSRIFQDADYYDLVRRFCPPAV